MRGAFQPTLLFLRAPRSHDPNNGVGHELLTPISVAPEVRLDFEERLVVLSTACHAHERVRRRDSAQVTRYRVMEGALVRPASPQDSYCLE